MNADQIERRAAAELAQWLHIAGAAGVGKVRTNYDAIEAILLRVADGSIAREAAQTAKAEEQAYMEHEADDLRRIHEAGCKRAYELMGIEDDGEYRWKWVALGISNLIDERNKAREAAGSAMDDGDKAALTDQERQAIEGVKHFLNTVNPLLDHNFEAEIVVDAGMVADLATVLAMVEGRDGNSR